ncbi:hypothetical protein NLS1_31510 [Nocardioides sp. LS1]|nr:hypothetical protein NLS1_31510 [Nocardioides sp. LS1]
MRTKKACELLEPLRGSHYGAKQPVAHGPARRPSRPTPPNALTAVEQEQELAVLTSERFCDKSIVQNWPPQWTTGWTPRSPRWPPTASSPRSCSGWGNRIGSLIGLVPSEFS